MRMPRPPPANSEALPAEGLFSREDVQAIRHARAQVKKGQFSPLEEVEARLKEKFAPEKELAG